MVFLHQEVTLAVAVCAIFISHGVFYAAYLNVSVAHKQIKVMTMSLRQCRAGKFGRNTFISLADTFLNE